MLWLWGPANAIFTMSAVEKWWYIQLVMESHNFGFLSFFNQHFNKGFDEAMY